MLHVINNHWLSFLVGPLDEDIQFKTFLLGFMLLSLISNLNSNFDMFSILFAFECLAFFIFQDSRIVYKHFATLYFVFVFDSSENELAMLDLIQGVFLPELFFLIKIIFNSP